MVWRARVDRRFISGLAFFGLSPLWFAEVPLLSKEFGVAGLKLSDEAQASDPDKAGETEPRGVQSLEEFVFPGLSGLRDEVGVTDRSMFDQSSELMAQWIRRSKQSNLASVCAEILDPEDDVFPMSGFNLRCAPWWLEQRSLSASGTADSSPRIGRNSIVRVRDEADWKKLAHLSYHEFLRGFPYRDQENLFRHASYVVRDGVGCDASIAMAGLLGRMEEQLPDRLVWDKMKGVYEKYAACERPSDHTRELVHLRTGLTALFFQDLDLARFSLERALVAPDRSETQRTLFWLGLMDDQAQRDQLVSHFRNRHWDRLWAESPLSIHAIIAAHVKGIDPYESLVGEVFQPLRNRDGSGKWTDFNLMAFVAELLVAKEDALALRAWSLKIAAAREEDDASKMLYLGLLHNKAHNYLQSIQSMSVYMDKTPGSRYRPEFMKLLFPTPYSDSILMNSQDLDPLLVYGLIRQESAFNPYARSRANARGLMQLLPGTARSLIRVAPRELYDPDKNVKIGTLYLQKLFERNDNQFERVLAAYNAGQQNLSRWTKRFPGAHELLFSDLIPFRETRNYVALIQRNTYWYGRLWTDQEDKIRPEILARLGQNKDRSRTVDLLLQASWQSKDKVDLIAHLPKLVDFDHFADRQ